MAHLAGIHLVKYREYVATKKLIAVREENITEVTWEELQEMEDLTNWERVKNMTEEEVEQNALDDPDAQPLPERFEKEAWVVYPYQQSSQP